MREGHPEFTQTLPTRNKYAAHSFQDPGAEFLWESAENLLYSVEKAPDQKGCMGTHGWVQNPATPAIRMRSTTYRPTLAPVNCPCSMASRKWMPP